MEKRVISGIITAWTVPVRDREGLTSVISLECDDSLPFSLSVTLPSAEDHTWHVGQYVVAKDVIFDTLTSGRTYVCPEGEKEKEERLSFPLFLDLPVKKVMAVQHQENGGLMVKFADGAVVTCVNHEKSRELAEIGIGGLVQLLSIKSTGRGLFVTEKSGVKGVVVAQPPPPPLSPPRPLEPPRPLGKWHCIVCGWCNYPSSSVCFDCKTTRKEGPLYKDGRLFPKREPIVKQKMKRLPPWMCKNCRYRDNWDLNEFCIKCRKVRE